MRWRVWMTVASAVRSVTAPSDVPVPAAGLLVLTGLAAMGAVRRRA